MMPRIPALILIAWTALFAPLTRAQEVEPPSVESAEAGSLLPLLGQNLSAPSPDAWVPGQWSQAQWNQTKLEQDFLGVSEGRYLSPLESEPDTVSISIESQNYKREKSTRRITFGLTAHTILLKKALLQKLGYSFPAVSPLKQVKIHFDRAEDKEAFKLKIEQETQRAVTRWIIEETDLTVMLQDVLVSQEKLVPTFAPEIVAPLVVADLPENANLYAWVPGTPQEDGYRISFAQSDQFHPTPEALHQVLQRLAKLSRTDWEFVVRQAALPTEVASLVLEKTIARSESLLSFYEIQHREVESDARVSDGESLQEGVLAEKDWTGYASDFSKAASDSMIDLGGNFRAFTRSKVFSLLLGIAVKKFNDLSFMHTPDFDTVLAKHDARNLAKMLELYTQTGEVQRIPFGVWGYGFAAGQLILSRDVVAGSFLGTNHLLQVIDQVGFRLNAGGELNLEGGPHYLEAELGGDIAVSRVYAHVKPIKSLTDPKTTEFKNAVLPYLIRKNARSLTVESLKKALKPGESLIITDSLVGNADLRAAAILYGFAELSASFQGTGLILNRFHVYRAEDGNIQVHQDKAESKLLAFAAAAGVRFKVPKFLRFLVAKERRNQKARFTLYTYRWANHAGGITSKFYPVTLNASSMEWLKPALASSNLEVLNSHVKPTVIHNDFKDRTNDHKFLFWSNRKLKSAMDLTLESPEGSSRTFVRDFFAKTSGRNFEKPSTDAITFLFNALTSANGLSTFATSINPGYTIFGQAKNQFVEYEAEKMPDGTLSNSFVKVTQAYNGWKLSRRKLQKYLKRLSKSAGVSLSVPKTVEDSPEVLLYNLSLNTHLNEQSLQRLKSLSRNDIYRAKAQAPIPDEEIETNGDSNDEYAPDEIYRMLEAFRSDRSPKHLMKALTLADDYLEPEAMVQLLGGPENVHFFVKIEGINPHNEKGVPEAMGSTVEIAGRKMQAGPLSAERERLNMTEGEFLSQWITGRVY